MDFEEACRSVINEYGLVRNERMAVLYTTNIGDFYSLCSTVEQAEKRIHKEVILLYCSEIHREILSWFDYGGHSIKGARIAEDVYSAIKFSSLESQKKYEEYFIFWQCGNEEFRKLTRNPSGDFIKSPLAPCFPEVDILQKYKEYILPGKTVFIVPEARTVQPFPCWFWNFAAYLFETMGYSVIFNAPPKSSGLYRGQCLLVPLSEVVRFADACGFVFGIRTGLFDVLSTSTAKMIIYSTKFYKPLNDVFNMDNSENRIRTVYYEDNDPFFQMTPPVNFVRKAFDEEFFPIKDLLGKLCEKESRDSGQVYPAHILRSYTCKKIFNKYALWDRGADIKPFAEVKYSFDIVGGKLAFSMSALTGGGYRVDYEVFCNDRCIAQLADMPGDCLSYPLEQSGEYFIKATVTDQKNFNQEYFETRRLVYTAPIPECLERLSRCRDIYSYVLALNHFSKDIIIFICSRDSHTFFKKNKDTGVLQNLRVLGLSADLEGTPRHSYIGVIDGSGVVYEMISEDKALRYNYESEGCTAVIESYGYNVTHSPVASVKIEINGVNKAVDARGLNIVVLDKKTKTMVDSVAFDTFESNRAVRRAF